LYLGGSNFEGAGGGRPDTIFECVFSFRQMLEEEIRSGVADLFVPGNSQVPFLFGKVIVCVWPNRMKGNINGK
jgi:hypothetical protein